MELLDLLEQRVTELLTEVAALRDENRGLREEIAAGKIDREDISRLQAELAQERQAREQAAVKVDAMLRRIQSSLGGNQP